MMFLYLEENFGNSKLEVGLSEYRLADFPGCRRTVFQMWWIDSSDQDSVSFDEVIEQMPYWISSSPDPNRLHHSRVAELTKAKDSIKHLNKHQTMPYVSL